MHGDLYPSNLLVNKGRIVAILDFGLLGVGDPACDLFVAWSFLDGPARAVFREVVSADEAMWARGRAWAVFRGRAWAVFNAVIALAFYLGSGSMLCDMSRRTLAEVSMG